MPVCMLFGMRIPEVHNAAKRLAAWFDTKPVLNAAAENYHHQNPMCKPGMTITGQELTDK